MFPNIIFTMNITVGVREKKHNSDAQQRSGASCQSLSQKSSSVGAKARQFRQVALG